MKLCFLIMESHSMANIIAEFLHMQYDINGYYYFLLDSFINYKKTNRAVELYHQNVFAKGKLFIMQ